MSEYQHVEFRAVDRPLNEKQLEYAEQQSSHAQVNKWSFVCDYHYSSFRGNVDGLLRHGYDVFLEYSNYGTRTIKLRLPDGLAFDSKLLKRFTNRDSLVWKKDAKSEAGILEISPFFEELDYDEDFDSYLESAILVREHLIQGDLRVLYLLWLCIAGDDNSEGNNVIEPPVPHGLGDLPEKCCDLLAFFGHSSLLANAAAEGIPAGPSLTPQRSTDETMVESMSGDRAKELLLQMLVGDPSRIKADLVQEARREVATLSWPYTDRKQSLRVANEICERLVDEFHEKQKKTSEVKARKDAANIEKKRQARMKEMLKDPDKWLKKSEKIAGAGGIDNYKAAADILADLRDAIGGTEGKLITRKHAAHIVKKHPTLNMLKSSLRKNGLLD